MTGVVDVKLWTSITMTEQICPLGLGTCVLGDVGYKESVDVVVW